MFSVFHCGFIKPYFNRTYDRISVGCAKQNVLISQRKSMSAKARGGQPMDRGSKESALTISIYRFSQLADCIIYRYLPVFDKRITEALSKDTSKWK